MAERLAFIVNPHATRVTDRLQAQVVDALARVGSVTTLPTTHSGHGAELARDVVRSRFDVVVVLGGDGTVNEVAGALAGTHTALVPLAGGSTNVFARAVGWPRTVEPSGLADAVAAGRRRTIRLGRLTFGGHDRLFLVNAGVGLDAETAFRVERHPWVKHHLRQVGFGVVATGVALRRVARPSRMWLSADGAREVAVATAVVAVGAPYAFFGPVPLDLAPEADFDGRLRWMGLTSVRPPTVVRAVSGALRGGRHLGGRGIVDGWAADEVRIRAEGLVAVQADGEPLGWHREIVARPGPDLTVVTPGPG